MVQLHVCKLLAHVIFKETLNNVKSWRITTESMSRVPVGKWLRQHELRYASILVSKLLLRRLLFIKNDYWLWKNGRRLLKKNNNIQVNVDIENIL